MIKIIECLGELIKIYAGTPSPKTTNFKKKSLGYALAGLLLISAVGFGYLALYRYLQPIWEEPYTSLMLSAGSFGLALILFLVLCYPKIKQPPALDLERVANNLITFSPPLLKGLRVSNISKKGWVSLLTIAGLYILLRGKQEK
ncbi:MAG: hypothetical protein IBJ00_06565 [Alphaproteobacteria bacterium]|nr:hypothetical protein [Alphaproteobacteria bacterium]